MEEEVLKIDCDEAIEYIKENVKTYDKIELSYNRIYTAGEVLNVDTSEYRGVCGLKLIVHIEGDITTSSVEVDLEEVKDDLVEVVHIPKDGNKATLLIIEKCDVDEDTKNKLL
jgi:hypothetical protein